MERYIVRNSELISSSIKISGSKNGFLPILIASILCSDTVTLKNTPLGLKDSYSIIKILKSLNVEFNYPPNGLTINPSKISNNEINEEFASRTRYSILLLGALSGLFDEYFIPLPGGCNLGSTRPIDMHVEGLQKMGANLHFKKNYIIFSRKGKLKGSHIIFRLPSVTATQNIILAATLADGSTILENAAMEPEVSDLCRFLNSCGADISGVGTRKIFINGVNDLKGSNHCIIPDRIEIGTFIALAAISKIKLELYPIIFEHISSIIKTFSNMGLKIKKKGTRLLVDGMTTLSPINIKSLKYPGFPTDMLPIISAVCVNISGESRVTDTIFPNRLAHLQEFKKLGAEFNISNNIVTIFGGNKLVGANLYVHNIRAGAAVVLLALVADGLSEIKNVSQIERGYEFFWDKLKSIGANIDT